MIRFVLDNPLRWAVRANRLLASTSLVSVCLTLLILL